MNKRDYSKFVTMLGLTPPPTVRQTTAMTAACRNWALLHPELANLEANEAGLVTCRQYLWVEMNREGGPRYHIADRLYKRFSNLRREMETAAMAALLPEPEAEEAEA